jgi:TetR/AcrR family transcriptional regulator, fatty acid biosynthesis regulator
MSRLQVRRSTAKARPPDPVPAAPSREARKLLTRGQLMAGALDLMGAGRGFSSLSLREVTRAAGVVPASFYRHFRDLDELGLALVEQSGATLRHLLRDVRRDGVPLTDMLRQSVLIYKQYVESHRLHFLFIAGERGGGSPVIRTAIRAEESHFAAEMVQDMRALGLLPGLSSETLRMLCGLVVTTMINAATDILDLPAKSPRAERELVDNFVRQLRLIFLGAGAWREKV